MRQDQARRAQRSQDLAFPRSAYTGTFHNELFGTMRWSEQDGKLRVAFGLAESDVEVYDAGKNQLRVELLGGGSVVTFHIENGSTREIEMDGIKFSRVE
jgi:hypothetical protein